VKQWDGETIRKISHVVSTVSMQTRGNEREREREREKRKREKDIKKESITEKVD